MAILAPAAMAADEVGDAGELPADAQAPGPAGPLTSIQGSISNTTDRDMYKVCLTSGPNFSARTVGLAGFDTQLFLLDSQGRAVYANDDSSDTRQSTLPANHQHSPREAGTYYLAIAPHNWDPWSPKGPLFNDRSGTSGPIWYPGPEIDPETKKPIPIRPPISRWAGNNLIAMGAYEIALTAVKACDTTAPAIDLRVPAEGATFERGQTVLADFSCLDEEGGSGVATCKGTVGDGQPIATSSLGAKTFSVTATDEDGNTRTVIHSYRVVDGTDPTVTLTTPPDGATYERDQVVVADYSCADEAGGSGIASCSGTVHDGHPIDTSSSGKKSFAVTATDRSGNTRTVTHSYTVSDETDPTVSLITPADDAVYERGEQVAADYSCADEPGGLGIASCEGSTPDGQAVDTSTLGSHEFTVTARDNAGNSSSVTHSYTVVDRTEPAVTLTTPSNGASYERGQAVVADFSCVDDAGGSGVATCKGTVDDGALIDTSSLGNKTFTVTATDRSGNTRSVTHNYSVVDTTGPAIHLRTPADGAEFFLNQRVLADYDCSDASGVTSCSGDVRDGERVDTSRFGKHSFRVSAVDGAGNTSVKTVTYTVLFKFSGFFRPLRNPPHVNVWTAGASVPVKFSLGGYRGPSPIASGYPISTETPCGASSAGKARRAPKRTRSRTRLSYKASGSQYIYMWRTDKRWAGTCRQFVLKLDDGSFHRADFRFPAKKPKRPHRDDD